MSTYNPDDTELMMALIQRNSDFEALLHLIEGGFYSRESFLETFNDLQESGLIQLFGTIITNPGDGTAAKEGPAQELTLRAEAKIEALQYFDKNDHYLESRFTRYGKKLFPQNDMFFTIQWNKTVEMIK